MNSPQSGDIAGFSQQVFPIRGSISAREIFGEVRIPLVADKLVRRLALEGGFRKSWYENPRSKFSSDAYKLALDLTSVTGLRLRASQQRANRAPNVQELFAPAQPDSFDRDPCAGISPYASETQCALTGVTPAQYGHVVTVDAILFGLQCDHGRQRRSAARNRDHAHNRLGARAPFPARLQRYDRLVGHQAEGRHRKNRRADDNR